MQTGHDTSVQEYARSEHSMRHTHVMYIRWARLSHYDYSGLRVTEYLTEH